MNWLNETAQQIAYPLRATWIDKAYVLIVLGCYSVLCILGVIVLIEYSW